MHNNGSNRLLLPGEKHPILPGQEPAQFGFAIGDDGREHVIFVVQTPNGVIQIPWTPAQARVFAEAITVVCYKLENLAKGLDLYARPIKPLPEQPRILAPIAMPTEE
jgi:hypothetical protein